MVGPWVERAGCSFSHGYGLATEASSSPPLGLMIGRKAVNLLGEVQVASSLVSKLLRKAFGRDVRPQEEVVSSGIRLGSCKRRSCSIGVR